MKHKKHFMKHMVTFNLDLQTIAILIPMHLAHLDAHSHLASDLQLSNATASGPVSTRHI